MRRCVACSRELPGPEWRCAECGWIAAVRDGVPSLLPGSDVVAEAFSAEQIGNLEMVDPGHFWFAGRNRLIALTLSRCFPGARSFLEVGCGTGVVLRALSEARPDLALTGTEVADEGLRAAARLAPAADLVRADTRALPYDAEFDVVGAFDVLEHIPQDGDAMAALARAARPGGGVMVTVPQHRWLWSPLDEYSGHQRRYRRRELIDLAARAGLEVLLVTSFVSLLLPLMVASRIAGRRGEVRPGREFAATSRVNGIAAAAMTVERALIAAGVSMPAGGSLLLAARKR